MRIKHPLLADSMTDAQRGSTENLSRERLGMDDGAYIGHSEKICNLVLARFRIDYDFRKAGYVRERLAVARIFVLRCGHESLPCQRRYRRFRYLIHIVGWLMPIVFAAQLDRVLRCLRQRYPSAAALAKDAFIRDFILLGLAAEFLGRDLLQFLLAVHCSSMRGASHRVRGLASSRDAGPRQVLGCVAPGYVALFPRHIQNFGDDPVYIEKGFRPQISDAGLDGDASVGLDDEQAVESDRSPDEATRGNTNASHHGSTALRSSETILPLELFGSAIEGFFQERARRMSPRSVSHRAYGRLALGTVHLSNLNLIEP